MGFIKIIEEKNPIEMHNKVYEASKNNALTPKFCMEVLSHTNMPIIMKEMLEKIEKLPIEEQKQYKKAILSMFDGRQTSEKVKNKALELAKNNGFESELNDVIERTGVLGYPARVGCDKICVIEKGGDYSNVDFSAYKCIVAGREIENMVEINNNNTLNGVLDLRGVDKVDLTRCNLSKVKHIIFEKMAAVYLMRATNLPTNLDVSMCVIVDLSDCDLRGLNLKFKEGSRVVLSDAKNLPSNLDLSMCGVVYLNDCYLSRINLKFKEGSKVVLRNVKEFPEKLDVSMCDEVSMDDANIFNVKELRFKNKEQLRRSGIALENPNDWEGKIIYTDDEKKKDVVVKQEENVSVWNKFKNMFGKDRS